MRYPISSFSNFLVFLFSSLLLISILQPCFAVREGTANANIMIKRYERSGDFGRAALWREAAAECLEIISIPMTTLMIKYYTRYGNNELAEVSRKELTDIEAQGQYHLKHAKTDWEKSKTAQKDLDEERQKIAEFIATWVPHYPDKFYDFGVYANFFRKRRDEFKQTGDYAKAINIEANAAEMCADQYNDIPIAYFKHRAERAEKAKQAEAAEKYQQRAAKYEKVRDAQRQRAALLRALAQQPPKAWPSEADKRKIEIPRIQTQLTPNEAVRAAESDRRVQELLKTHKGVHEYAWFQGFAWTVSFYNHGWGNLAIAIIDDKTGKVIDVLNQVGNLEEREWEEKKKNRLRLKKAEVENIARSHPRIASFAKVHPEARLSAAFSKRYNCWMVEVIRGDKEVGFVSVSDEKGKVLEIEIDQ
ncbi:MAG: hypothetical protein ACE1ZS_09285 [Candidatus Poribacteria bacterium]